MSSPAASPSPLIDTAGASAQTGVPARTLEDWRYKRTGPPYYKLNGSVRYSPAELTEWAARHRIAA